MWERHHDPVLWSCLTIKVSAYELLRFSVLGRTLSLVSLFTICQNSNLIVISRRLPDSRLVSQAASRRSLQPALLFYFGALHVSCCITLCAIHMGEADGKGGISGTECTQILTVLAAKPGSLTA